LRPPALSEAGRAKAICHAERVRERLPQLLGTVGLASDPGSFALEFRSANTFPEASGIASSASSFAAITLGTALAGAADSAAFAAAYDSHESGPLLKHALAALSREGSGSSCRSFEGNFVAWEGEGARAVPSALGALAHFVVLISAEAKAVSSSDAHARVKSSPLWTGRVERATARFKRVADACARGDWHAVSRETARESWEMHSLFHTSETPFTYWKPGSLEALEWLAAQAGEPIVTMDAGPNVHVIVPALQGDAWAARLEARFGADRVLRDRPGSGARIVEY
jgi:diphosphomevalonate decarboxylase